MALFMFHADRPEDGNSQQINSVIVEAADEAAARVAAQEVAPNGEVKVRPTWAVINLGSGTLSAPVWIRGRKV